MRSWESLYECWNRGNSQEKTPQLVPKFQHRLLGTCLLPSEAIPSPKAVPLDFAWTTLSSPNDGTSPIWTHFPRKAQELTSLLGKVLSNLNSFHGNPLEVTKSKTIWSLLLARKRLSRNSPLGVRIRSLLTGSASSFGSGGRACSKESRMA